jgi:hypothetical protein
LKRFSLHEKKDAIRFPQLKLDSAETFQEVLRFLLQHASKVAFLIAKFRSNAHFCLTGGMLLKSNQRYFA